MHAEDSIRDAVTRAANKWANPGGGPTADHEWTEDVGALIEGILAEIAKSDLNRDVRSLRWKVKNLGKSNGRQGQQIYDLRCQLAEARSLITVDASSHRRARDEARGGWKRVTQLNEEIRQLQLQLRVNRAESVVNSVVVAAGELASTNGHAMAEVIRGLA